VAPVDFFLKMAYPGIVFVFCFRACRPEFFFLMNARSYYHIRYGIPGFLPVAMVAGLADGIFRTFTFLERYTINNQYANFKISQINLPYVIEISVVVNHGSTYC
jgi:hypothetical protein